MSDVSQRRVDYIKILPNAKTIILHKIRVDLGLSLREYVLLDFIYNWHFVVKNKKPITFGDYLKETGIRQLSISRMFQKLKEKGLLFKDADGKVKTTNKWNDNFNIPDFDNIWKLHPVGNKQKALFAFSKAIKVDTVENIISGIDKYKIFLEKSDQFPQHLSTFLNYKLKWWQSDFDISKLKTQQQDNKMIITTGPKSKFD